MKRSKLLIANLVIAFLFLTYLTARAGKTQDNDDKLSAKSNKGNASQPINNYVCFLIITGAAIGYKVVTDKAKH